MLSLYAFLMSYKTLRHLENCWPCCCGGGGGGKEQLRCWWVKQCLIVTLWCCSRGQKPQRLWWWGWQQQESFMSMWVLKAFSLCLLKGSSLLSCLVCKAQLCPYSTAGARRAGRGRSAPVSWAPGFPEGCLFLESLSGCIWRKWEKQVTYYWFGWSHFQSMVLMQHPFLKFKPAGWFSALAIM